MFKVNYIGAKYYNSSTKTKSDVKLSAKGHGPPVIFLLDENVLAVRRNCRNARNKS